MAGTRILLVEADVPIGKELAVLLAGLGYSITSVVHSGRNAVQKALEQRPDVILMDVALKGDMDGVAAADEILSHADIPIVFSLARGDKEELQATKPIPPYGYVLKPYQKRELEMAVETALYVARMSSEQKRTNEKLRRQKEYLDALHETSLGLLKRLKLGDLLEDIVSRACALVGCDHGYIHLYEPETDSLEIKAGWGPFDKSIGFRLNPGLGLVGKVFETGAPIMVDDYRTWQERLPDPKFERIRAAVAMPLKSGTHVHGVIALVYREEGKTFGDEEIDIVSRFAELASITLENVRLYDAIERELDERKRAEAALKESEEKYRLLIENSGDIVYALGPDFRHTYVSPVVERLTGYTAEEATRQTIDEIFTPSSAEILRTAYRRRIREEATGIHRDDVERWELEHKHKDGSTVWGEVSVKPIRDAAGRFAGLQGVTRDITARKQAERALLESEEKYRLVAYATSDIIFEFRLEDGVYTYISPNCEQILGYTAEELSSSSFFMKRHMVRPEDLEEIKKTYVAALKGPDRQLTYEFRVRCKNGDVKHLLESCMFIRDADGKVTTMIGSYKDVTEKKRMEAQLRQAQKMQAIGTLAGGIAHDFNNILAAIMGYTELALIHLQEDHPARKKLGQVLKSGERAKSLVHQILSFSRQTDQERRPLELGPIVKEALKLLRASLPSTIEIKRHVTTNPAVVLADPTQIHQLIMNLCTNAAHAMRRNGGVLEISLERAELDERSAGQYADLGSGTYQRLTVSDTGHGMDQKTLERIFEPFFTTKAPGEGTGMGLAVVHGIVKSHEGAIAVYSEPGVGSTFRVYLPEIQMEAKKEPSADVETAPEGGERILFVDDEHLLVDIGRQTLERLGYRVTGLTSATEALDLFRKAPDEFDLVITDQTMPNVTGIHLATEMLMVRPDMPIILCTGFSHDATSEKALACGIKRFLMKPVTAREVAKVVREVLDGC
ncbi:MAG: PAS domain S-box protein [Deltaproteobacteria bacterium]|nr:PAS domain S-box protein [Deltaproteobacteria bacterium]